MKKLCVICKKEMDCFDKPNKGRRSGVSTISKRRSNVVTCCPKHARYYMNAYNYLRLKLKIKSKEEGK